MQIVELVNRQSQISALTLALHCLRATANGKNYRDRQCSHESSDRQTDQKLDQRESWTIGTGCFCMEWHSDFS